MLRLFFSSVCDILAIFVSQLRDAAHLIHTVAQIVFYTTLGNNSKCMNKHWVYLYLYISFYLCTDVNIHIWKYFYGDTGYA
jgi:hypothetical protein